MKSEDSLRLCQGCLIERICGLKAGASMVEPEVYLNSSDNHYHMSVDKGEGNEPSGETASKVGDISNGLFAEEDRHVLLK